MLEPAAILKFAYPIFAERVTRSERRKRWRSDQLCGLGLSRASNTRSPWGQGPGCCIIGGRPGFSSLLPGCEKCCPRCRYRPHEIILYLVSPLAVDLSSSCFVNKFQLSIKVSEGRAELFALPQLWFQQREEEVWHRDCFYRQKTRVPSFRDHH